MTRLIYCEDCGWRPETVEETKRLHEHHISETETITVCSECHRKRHGFIKRGSGYVSPIGNENAKTEILRLRVTKAQKEMIREKAGEDSMSRFVLQACVAFDSGEG